MNKNIVMQLNSCIRFVVVVAMIVTHTMLPLVHAASSTGFTLAQLEIETTVTAEIDLDPPLVDHIPVSSGVAGSMQSFSVKATDTRGIESVTLYYRAKNQDAYSSAAMTRLAGTDNYAVSVQSSEQQRQFEYYFLVVDTGGNKVLNGFPYEPFERFLSQPLSESANGDGQPERLTGSSAGEPSAQPVPVEPGIDASSASGSSKTILWGVLGVLILGALVSGSLGGDEGNSGGARVPVTVSVPLPR